MNSQISLLLAKQGTTANRSSMGRPSILEGDIEEEDSFGTDSGCDKDSLTDEEDESYA